MHRFESRTEPSSTGSPADVGNPGLLCCPPLNFRLALLPVPRPRRPRLRPWIMWLASSLGSRPPARTMPQAPVATPTALTLTTPGSGYNWFAMGSNYSSNYGYQNDVFYEMSLGEGPQYDMAIDKPSDTAGFGNVPGVGQTLNLGSTTTWVIATAQPAPEPSTVTLLGTALMGLGVVYLRRRRAKA